MKQLMNERNPAKRDVVKPVNLYTNKSTSRLVNNSTNQQIVRYTTYLDPEMIKIIKRYAVDNDTKDMLVVQKALDEFFKDKTST